MAKTNKKNTESIMQPISINEIREKINEAIVKEYGSLAEFIKSEYCKKIGANSIRVYLTNKGGVSLPLFTELSNHFHIGKIHREIKVSRETKYFLEEEK